MHVGVLLDILGHAVSVTNTQLGRCSTTGVRGNPRGNVLCVNTVLFGLQDMVC